MSTCANIVAYLSFRALSGPPTSVLVIIIGLIACAPLEIIVPRLCPSSEIFLAPPLTNSHVYNTNSYVYNTNSYVYNTNSYVYNTNSYVYNTNSYVYDTSNSHVKLIESSDTSL